MATNLFESLQSDPILLPQGLRITLQMADAVENCWDRRIYHVDLRITNILVTTLLNYIRILNPFNFSVSLTRVYWPIRCLRIFFLRL